MKTYTLWMEGYAATGESGGARCLGSFEAETFVDAVKVWDRECNYDKGFGTLSVSGGQASVWGCRIFDNQRDAQRSFG